MKCFFFRIFCRKLNWKFTHFRCRLLKENKIQKNWERERESAKECKDKKRNAFNFFFCMFASYSKFENENQSTLTLFLFLFLELMQFYQCGIFWTYPIILYFSWSPSFHQFHCIGFTFFYCICAHTKFSKLFAWDVFKMYKLHPPSILFALLCIVFLLPCILPFVLHFSRKCVNSSNVQLKWKTLIVAIMTHK